MKRAYRMRLLILGILVVFSLVGLTCALAHDHTLHKFLHSQRRNEKTNTAVDSNRAASDLDLSMCELTVKLIDHDLKKSLPGLIRITDVKQDKPLIIKELIKREHNWFAMPDVARISVPQTTLTIEALHGLETELTTKEIDLTDKEKSTIELSLRRFYDASSKRLRSGNTHLHLMNLTHAEADRYLRVVPKSDDLDLVFLSHLRRIPDERNYISNGIVENSLAGGELARLSQDGVLFRPGEEHRHNFGRGGEGYGHVMFLDIVKLIRPVSIGPGIMREGTDGIPIQRGIKEARSDGASVVWCHNTFGFEDVPNWMEGLLDAQNIFDGGNHGSYKDTFYRYLNLGMKVPFSTGTDWFIYDFSRVYVPVDGELTSKKWLTQLAAGRSFITNGTFLEFEANEAQVGDTISLKEPDTIKIKGRGEGRTNFKQLQLVFNGKVVATTESKKNDGHFASEMKHTLTVDQPGWITLRIPLEAGNNEFGKPMFAHTSPIYIEIDKKRIFQPEIAKQLIGEIEKNIKTIKEKSKFADEEERMAVLQVHRKGIGVLRNKIAENQQ